MINRTRHQRLISTALTLVMVAEMFGGVFSIPVAQAAAGIFRPISYQGKVTSTGGVAIANGSYNMRFKMFSAASGGIATWTETWDNSSQRVTMTGGLFSVLLGTHVTMTGSVNFNTDSLYLQVEFDPGNDGVYEETFNPRRRFASVPYAHNANTLDGLDASQFVRKDQSEVMSGTLTIKPNDPTKVGADIVSTAGAAATAALKLSTQGANHIVFGTGAANYDTNLYRSAVSTLRTDGVMIVAGNMSGKSLSIMSGNPSYILGDVGIGKSGTPKAKLDVLGTISGSSLTINGSITNTGSLTTRGTITFRSLTGCAALVTNSSGVVSCGTPSGTFGSGNVITIGDGRYVNTSGDTMTGALNVRAMLSGSRLSVSGNANITGALMVRGNIRTLGTLALGDSNTATDTISFTMIDSSASLRYDGDFSFDDRVAVGKSSGPAGGLTFEAVGIMSGALMRQNGGGVNYFMGDMAIGKTTLRSGQKFEVLGTISGSALKISNLISGSGGLTVRGAIAFRSLTGCSTLQTDSNGLLSCGSAGSSFGSGNVITIGNQRYVSKQGDTMTGALTIQNGNTHTATATPLLNVRGTMSGRSLWISGSSTLPLLYTDATNNRVGIGTSAPKATFEVVGTVSGSRLVVSDRAAIGTSVSATAYEKLIVSGSENAGQGIQTIVENTATTGASNPVFANFVMRTGTSPTNDGMFLGGKGTAFWQYGVVNGITMRPGSATQDLGLAAGNGVSGTAVGPALIVKSDAKIAIGDTSLWVASNPGIGQLSIIPTAGTVPGMIIYGSAQSAQTANLLELRNLSSTVLTSMSQSGWLAVNRTAKAKVALEVTGTISGSALTINGSITNTGSLTTRGTITFRSLTGCAALVTNSSGVVSCGTPSGTFGSGNVITIGDGRYVNTSGDTMTGALTIQNGNTHAATTTPLLNIRGTMSGRSLYISGTGSSALFMTDITTGRVGIGSSAPKATLAVVGSISGTTLRVTSPGSASAPSLAIGRLAASGFYDSGMGGIDVAVSGAQFGTFWMTGGRRIFNAGGGTLEFQNSGNLGIAIDSNGNAAVGAISGATGQRMTVYGSISGTQLKISNLISGSGGLTVRGAIAFRTLTGCSALQTDSNGVISCGSSAGTFGSGNVITIGNQRYVSKQGDTMTGALVINVTGGTRNTLGLRVINTLSGAHLHAEQLITSSGAGIFTGNLTTKGTLSGNALTVSSFPATRIPFMGAGGSMTTSANMTWNGNQLDLNSTGNTGFRTYVNGGDGWYFYNGAGGTGNFGMYDIDASKDRMTLLGDSSVRIGNEYAIPDIHIDTSRNVAIGKSTNTIKAKLDVLGTISGSQLVINGSITNTGSLTTRGTITFRSLTGCAALVTNSSGVVSCGNPTGTFGSGNVITIGNQRYVSKQGDTMTGALVIAVTGGNQNTLGLRVINTMSGAIVQATKQLRSSGTLITESGAVFDGGTLFVDAAGDRIGIGTLQPLYDVHVEKDSTGTGVRNVTRDLANTGSAFVEVRNADNAAATLGVYGPNYVSSPYFTSNGALSATNGLFIYSDSGVSSGGANSISFMTGGNDPLTQVRMVIDSSGRVSIGKSSVTSGQKFEVLGTISGSALKISNLISGSGGMTVRGAIAFRSLTSCTTLQTDSNGVLSCGSGGGSFGSGNVITIGNQRYVSKQGDTMTGALVIQNGNTHSATAAALLNVRGTMSGRSLYISGTGSSALFMTNITTGRVGIGTSAPKTTLDVIGTISGSALRLNGNALVNMTSTSASGVVINGLAGQTSPFLSFRNAAGFPKLQVDAGGFLRSQTGVTVISRANAGSFGGDFTFQIKRDGSNNAGNGAILRFTDNNTNAYIKWISNSFSQGVMDLEFHNSNGLNMSMPSGGGVYFYNPVQNSSDISIVKVPGQTLYPSGGTHAYQATFKFDPMTFAGTSPLTVTRAIQLYIRSAPIRGNNMTFDKSTAAQFDTGGSNYRGLIIRGGNSQSGSLMEFTNTGHTILSAFTASGYLALGGQNVKKTLVLEAYGTMSGRSLHISNLMSGSGGLTARGSITFRSLTSCSSLQSDSTGLLSCGSASSSFGSGNVITIGDGRYVNTSGDTMTGVLAIQNGNTHAATATPLLNVRGTMSGRSLYVSGSGASPILMTSIARNRVGIGTSSPKATLDVVGTISGSALTVSSFPATRIPFMGAGGAMTTSANLIWNGNQLDMNSSSNTGFRTYLNGGDGWYFYTGAGGAGNFGMFDIDAGKDRLTLLEDSSVRMGNDYNNPDFHIDTSRNVAIGKSTNTIKAKLDVLGTISGSSLRISSGISASGGVIAHGTIALRSLTSCTTLQTDSSGVLSCGSGGGSFGSGNVITIGNQRYVSKQGDTMTGALRISVTGGDINTLGLRVVNTMSGAHLHAEKLLTSSGALRVEGTGNSYIMGSVGIGTASPQQPLHVVGETDGSAIGPLLVTYAGGSAIGVALTLDATAAAGGKKFSFISTGNTAGPSGGKFAVYNGSDNRYVFLADDNGQYIAGVNQYTSLGQITSYPNSATTKGLVVRGAASQTAFLQEWQNSAGTGLAVITATGALGLGTSSPKARLAVSGATVISDRGNVVASRAAKATLDVLGTISGSLITQNGAGSNYFLGNLGIGTAAPSTKLHISNAGPYTMILQNSANTGNVNFIFSNTDGDVHVGRNITAGNGAFEVYNAITAQALLFVSEAGNVGIGRGLVPAAKLAVSGSTVISALGNVVSGRTAKATLDVIGSISGSSLYISNLNAASCDVKSTNGVLSCGTDATGGAGGFGSGNVITIGNQRYVSKQGDTMTGALVIQNGNTHSATATALLNVRGTMSGKQLWISGSGTSPLIYTGNGRVGIGTSSPKASLDVIGTMSGTTVIGSYRGAFGTNNTALGTVAGVSTNSIPSFYGAAQVGGGSSTPIFDINNFGSRRFALDAYGQVYLGDTTSLNFPTFGTSQAALNFSNNLGDKQYLYNGSNASRWGFGIQNWTFAMFMDGGNPGTGKFSWRNAPNSSAAASTGDDVQNLYTTGTLENIINTTTAKGHIIRISSARQTGNAFEIQSGATVLTSMSQTGWLAIGKTGKAITALDVVGTVSGAGLVINGTSTLYGNLVPGYDNRFDLGTGANRWRHLYLSGGTLNIGAGTSSGSISYRTSGTEGLMFFGRATSATPSMFISSGGFVGIGTSNPRSALEVFGTISGSALRISGGLSTSGALLLEGALSGATINGFGLGNDCDGSANKITWDVTTSRFKCEADQTGGGSSSFGSGNVITIGNNRYVRKSGDTMTGALIIQNGNTHAATSPPLLTVRGTMSGKQLWVSGSGTAPLIFTGTGRIGFGTKTPKAFMDVNGTIENGLVGYWPMDELGGNQIVDYSTSNNSGAFVGSMARTVGRFGRALSFNGSSYVTMGAQSELAGLQVPLTLAGWFKQTNTTGNQVVYAAYTGTNTHRLWSMIRMESGVMVYYTSLANGTYQAVGTLSAPAGQWHFFSVTVSGTTSSPTATLTLNNLTQTFSLAAMSTTPDLTVPVVFGSTSLGGEYLSGLLDNFTIHNRALSRREIADLYRNNPLGNGGTMISALRIESGATLDVAGMMSGHRLTVSGNANITGALLVRGGITTRAMLSGARLTVSGNANITGALLVAGGITTRAMLSGARLTISGNANITGALLVRGNITTRGTFSGAGLVINGTSTFFGNVVPGADNRYDLGTNSVRWRHLYLSGGTLNIGTATNSGAISYRTSGAEGLMFYGKASAFASPSMFISSGGLVAIGKTSVPKATFEVVGSMSGKSLYISGSGGMAGLVTDVRSGKIGIGTSTPKDLLHMYATNRDSQIYFQTRTVGAGGGTSSGPNSPGTLASDSSFGTVAWGSTSNAASQNDTYASLELSTSQNSQYLKATNFGFSIPSNATITGITAEVDKKADATTVSDARARIVKGGTIGSTDKSVVGAWTTVDNDTYSSYGGSSDLWSDTWSYTDINDSTFGFAIAANFVCDDICLGGAPNTFIDHIRITVAYTTGGPTPIYGDWVMGSDVDDSGNFKLIQSGSTMNTVMEVASGGLVGIGTGTSLTAKMTIYTDNGLNQPGLIIQSAETTSTQDMFRIRTNYSTTNNAVYRITASGATYADAPYNSAGADYAEYFPSNPQTQILAGEAVCLDTTKPNMVKRCEREADPNIIGIRSTKPSVVGNAVAGKVLDGLGLPVPGYTLVGLIGQLEARAIVASSASGSTVTGALVIKPGDSLTSASKPGYLRKAMPGESTVGVALTGLASGEGEVRVLIARTNTSNLTDKIDAEVTAHIGALKVDDKIKASLEETLSASSFDARISSAVTTQLSALQPMQDRVSTLEETILSLDNQLDALSSQLSGALLNGVGTSNPTGSNLTLTGSLAANALSAEETLAVGRDARIGGDLYLEGALIMTGDMNLSGNVTTGKLTAASGSQIAGTFTVAGDLLVAKNLTFQTGAVLTARQLLLSGALIVRGPITIEGLATFLGDVQVKGELIVSSRQAGFAIIDVGQKEITVRFEPPFKATPVVTATSDAFTLWRVKASSMTGFTLEIQSIATEKMKFSWQALTVETPMTVSGTFLAVPEGQTLFPLDAQGVPLSTSAIWNACIRHQQPLDPVTGQPFSCSRYTPDLYIWNHPDFPGMTFVWNDSYDPPLLILPDGYVGQKMTMSSSSSSTDTGTGSSISSSSESSASSDSSASSESSSSDSSSSDSSDSSSSDSSESSESSDSSSSDSSSSDSSSSDASSSDSSSSESSSSEGSSSSQ